MTKSSTTDRLSIVHKDRAESGQWKGTARVKEIKRKGGVLAVEVSRAMREWLLDCEVIRVMGEEMLH